MATAIEHIKSKGVWNEKRYFGARLAQAFCDKGY